MSGVELDPEEPVAEATVEADQGPGIMMEIWDAVTEGVFRNLHFDTFFIIIFVTMLLLFLCYLLPWMLAKIDDATKFELTPEMQAELKELMKKKERGEYTSKSTLMN